MSLNSRKSLIKRLMRGRKTRQQFVESHLLRTLAFQVRAMRDGAEWTQTELADHAGTTQNGVYKLEAGVASPTLSTLKKIAAAFDVALVVRFAPFSELVDWVSGTPRVERGLRSETFAVPKFEDDVFSDTTSVATATACETFYISNATGSRASVLADVQPVMLKADLPVVTGRSYAALGTQNG